MQMRLAKIVSLVHNFGDLMDVGIIGRPIYNASNPTAGYCQRILEILSIRFKRLIGASISRLVTVDATTTRA